MSRPCQPVPATTPASAYMAATGNKFGKISIATEWDAKMYDGNDWAGRKPGQPFFMQVQLHGGKHRGQGPNANWQARVHKEFGANTKPEDVTLPPYYPRDPVILQDWADYLDCCRFTDKEVGDVMARLEKEKLLDDTVVFCDGPRHQPRSRQAVPLRRRACTFRSWCVALAFRRERFATT
ncbi:MAG: sulfatase-like hydrolase/transferase [Gemmataceae bacterium]